MLYKLPFRASTSNRAFRMLSPMSFSATIGSMYYCHECAERHGLLNDLQLTGSNPSTFQIAKARKHAGPTSTTTGINSVLNSGSTAEQDYLSHKALEAGFVEVEANGCRALVYQSSAYIGTRFDSAAPTEQLDSFRWVLSTGSSLAHGYPVSSTKYSGATCVACSCSVSS